MYYGVELADVYLRKVSFRKAGVYISHLPPESATMTSIRIDLPDDVAREEHDASLSKWSSTEMLIAQMIDEIRVLRYFVSCFASSKGSHIPQPEPVPRPGVGKKPKVAEKRYTPEQMKRLDPRLRRDSDA
jgi:hypothetical protein